MWCESEKSRETNKQVVPLERRSCPLAIKSKKDKYNLLKLHHQIAKPFALHLSTGRVRFIGKV